MIMIYSSMSSKISSLEAKVKGLKDILQQISTHMKIPEHSINDELREMVKEGNDVLAVKKVREVLGLSLLEAKQYIDDL